MKHYSHLINELNEPTEKDLTNLHLVQSILNEKLDLTNEEEALDHVLTLRFLFEDFEGPEESDGTSENDDIESKLNAEIESEDIEKDQKKLFSNLKDLIPALKKMSGNSYKKVLLIIFNYLKFQKDEKFLPDNVKAALSDIAFDLINVILRNDKLVSIINTESKLILNSDVQLDIKDMIMLEEVKKKKAKSKKKSADDKITPKLEMLLRLGLVDRQLFFRAKKALTNKKTSGSIPMYRNLIFDILNDIVAYIEKDPTLYNRLRINILKEIKNSYPKKQTLMDAYLAGKTAKETGLTEEDIPEDYKSEYLLKSSWKRGYNGQ